MQACEGCGVGKNEDKDREKGGENTKGKKQTNTWLVAIHSQVYWMY